MRHSEAALHQPSWNWDYCAWYSFIVGVCLSMYLNICSFLCTSPILEFFRFFCKIMNLNARILSGDSIFNCNFLILSLPLVVTFPSSFFFRFIFKDVQALDNLFSCSKQRTHVFLALSCKVQAAHHKIPHWMLCWGQHNCANHSKISPGVTEVCDRGLFVPFSFVLSGTQGRTD